jgi:serine/threonine-protein kinase RsbW
MTPARSPKSSLVISNTIAEMAKVVEFIDRFGSDNRIPQSVINDLNLCLDELLNNTISYGYEDREAHSIAVGLSIVDGLLTAEIRYDGKPFDPRKPTPATSGDTLQSRKVGGLGLQFVKTLMDDLAYQRVGRMNVVRIKKRLRGDPNNGNR